MLYNHTRILLKEVRRIIDIHTIETSKNNNIAIIDISIEEINSKILQLLLRKDYSPFDFIDMTHTFSIEETLEHNVKEYTLIFDVVKDKEVIETIYFDKKLTENNNKNIKNETEDYKTKSKVKNSGFTYVKSFNLLEPEKDMENVSHFNLYEVLTDPKIENLLYELWEYWGFNKK